MDNQLPKVVQDCHNLIFWLIPQLDKFPRSRRFTLGERIENNLLSILANLASVGCVLRTYFTTRPGFREYKR